MALAPETVILALIRAFIEVIKFDWENEINKDKTFLSKICKDNYFDDEYNYYDQAKELLFRESPNNLEIDLFFNLEKVSVPHIHIVLPGENSNFNGIGIDEGFEQDEEDEENNTSTANYNRTFELEYNIVITSGNKMETTILYHVLKCICIACMDSFSHNGIQDVKFFGKDMQLNDFNAPDTFFVKTLAITGFYDLTVPSLDKKPLLKKLGIGDISEILESKKIKQTINKIIYNGETTS